MRSDVAFVDLELASFAIESRDALTLKRSVTVAASTSVVAHDSGTLVNVYFTELPLESMTAITIVVIVSVHADRVVLAFGVVAQNAIELDVVDPFGDKMTDAGVVGQIGTRQEGQKDLTQSDLSKASSISTTSYSGTQFDADSIGSDAVQDHLRECPQWRHVACRRIPTIETHGQRGFGHGHVDRMPVVVVPLSQRMFRMGHQRQRVVADLSAGKTPDDPHHVLGQDELQAPIALPQTQHRTAVFSAEVK